MQVLSMRRRMIVAAFVCGGLFIFMVAPVAEAVAQEAPFRVERLVVGTDVQDREPLGVTDVFPVGTHTVYCFLEARDVSRPVKLQMVWYFGEEEVARVPLALGASPRWRTYASKKVGERRGNWKVYLQDENDQILGTVQFVVE